MRLRTLLIAAMSLIATAMTAQTKTAYAVYCGEGDTPTLYFLNSEKAFNADGTYTTGEKITGVWSGAQVTSSSTSGNPQWINVVKGALKRVVFESTFAEVRPVSCCNWFMKCSLLAEIQGIENLKTDNVTTMSGMFSDCSSLTQLDVSGFNTENVTTMSNMFYLCSGLTQLDVRGFDTGEVTTMSGMFSRCSGLTQLDLSGFKTEKVTNMALMFSGCSSLTQLDVIGFKTGEVKLMNGMFSGCSGLTQLDLSSFTTEKLSDVNGIFTGCGNLKVLDMRNASLGYNIVTWFSDFAKRGMLLYLSDVTDFSEDNFAENYVVLPSAGTTSFAREFTANNMSTICLPFAVDVTTVDGTFYKYSKIENDEVKFTAVTGSTEAGTPYLFMPNTSEVTVFTGNATLDGLPTDEGRTEVTGLNGVYATKKFSDSEVSSGLYYGWANGKFWRAGTGSSVKQNRAYLKIAETQGVNPAQFMVRLDNGATAVDNITVTTADPAAPVYNLNGQRVGAGYKGIVIKNGKKVGLPK